MDVAEESDNTNCEVWHSVAPGVIQAISAAGLHSMQGTVQDLGKSLLALNLQLLGSAPSDAGWLRDAHCYVALCSIVLAA